MYKTNKPINYKTYHHEQRLQKEDRYGWSQKQGEFSLEFSAYVIVNAFLVGIWFFYR